MLFLVFLYFICEYKKCHELLSDTYRIFFNFKSFPLLTYIPLRVIINYTFHKEDSVCVIIIMEECDFCTQNLSKETFDLTQKTILDI